MTPDPIFAMPRQRSVTRRRFITGIAAAASGTGGLVLANRYGLIPPDHAGIFGLGETVTYAAHRALLATQPLAREFDRGAISTNFPAINTTLPEVESYRRDMASGFREWRLSVDGL